MKDTPMTDDDSKILELVERVEAARGPSKHLDAQIYILLDPEAQHIVGKKPGRFPQEAIYGPRISFWEWATDESKEPPEFAPIPCFTASLDAAMTLVPEDAGLDAAGERFRLEAWTTNGVHADHIRATAWVAGAPRVYAATPALALCAAALRARASGDR